MLLQEYPCILANPFFGPPHIFLWTSLAPTYKWLRNICLENLKEKFAHVSIPKPFQSVHFIGLFKWRQRKKCLRNAIKNSILDNSIELVIPCVEDRLYPETYVQSILKKHIKEHIKNPIKKSNSKNKNSLNQLLFLHQKLPHHLMPKQLPNPLINRIAVANEWPWKYILPIF